LLNVFNDDLNKRRMLTGLSQSSLLRSRRPGAPSGW
jgi:hypothetical protein